MQVTLYTLAECKQVSYEIGRVCRAYGISNGHDIDSCACDPCKTYRMMREVVQRLGSMDRPELERDQYER